MQVGVDLIDKNNFLKKLPSETSATVKARVQKARKKQYYDRGILNNNLSGKALEKACKLSKKDQAILEKAFAKFQLSARAYHRILRIARTIADLTGCEQIQNPHLMEALSYRRSLFHCK